MPSSTSTSSSSSCTSSAFWYSGRPRAIIPTYPVDVYKCGGAFYSIGTYRSLEVQAFDANGIRIYDSHTNNGGTTTGTYLFPGDCDYIFQGSFANAGSPDITVVWPPSPLYDTQRSILVYDKIITTGMLSGAAVAFGGGTPYCSNEGLEPEISSVSSLSSQSLSSISSQSSDSSDSSDSSLSSQSLSSISSQSSDSSVSSMSSSSESESTGFLCNEYAASGFTILSANGCYSRTGSYENEQPIYSNGFYYLKFGGEAYPRWYLQRITSLAIHYWSDVDATPENDSNEYTAQIGLGVGGTIICGCDSSSQGLSWSSESGFNSVSSQSSVSSKSSSSTLLSSTSSSSYYKNLPINLASYVSTCKNMSDITNPATGTEARMMVRGYFNEKTFPEYPDLTIMGGLVRTSANGGWLDCKDASKLFSMNYGMVRITLNAPHEIKNGIYEALAGKTLSASPDMVIFSVNPGDSYISPPGIYAALTPEGIEFTVWSDGSKVKIVDSATTIDPETDVIIAFAWDYSRKMLVDSQRVSVAIFVDGVATATSDDPIVPGQFDNLFSFGQTILGSPSSATEEPYQARFSLGDIPSGKNGLVGIAIRRIEIYKEPYGMEKVSTPDADSLQPLFRTSSMGITLPMTVEATRWVSVDIDEPRFLPATSLPVVLTETGEVPPQQDLGAMEDETYPETPSGLPLGIEEVRGRP